MNSQSIIKYLKEVTCWHKGKQVSKTRYIAIGDDYETPKYKHKCSKCKCIYYKAVDE